ncbi:hypothetical protein GGR54DRAFT_419206 [Hypoxylon sp. NC1633]|nr:hypothetical protein GGR54DRAFT_419206 [Hypoxylon sp. NC1633]
MNDQAFHDWLAEPTELDAGEWYRQRPPSIPGTTSSIFSSLFTPFADLKGKGPRSLAQMAIAVICENIDWLDPYHFEDVPPALIYDIWKHMVRKDQ